MRVPKPGKRYALVGLHGASWINQPCSFDQGTAGEIPRFCGHVTSLRDMSALESGKRCALAPLHGAFWISWSRGFDHGRWVSQQGSVATSHRCAI